MLMIIYKSIITLKSHIYQHTVLALANCNTIFTDIVLPMKNFLSRVCSRCGLNINYYLWVLKIKLRSIQQCFLYPNYNQYCYKNCVINGPNLKK